MADTFKPLKGMIKDTGRMDQVDGSYRDALNLIVDDLRLNVANEYGTTTITGLTLPLILPTGSITIGMNIVGQIALLDDNFVLFTAGEHTLPSGIVMTVSAIYKVNVANRSAKVLYYTTSVDPASPSIPNPKGHLNFDLEHPVTAELRESPTQEEIIYFTDNKHKFVTDTSTGIEYVEEYNPPRVFNVTKQEQSVLITNDPSNLYGTNSRTEFLNLFMDSGRIPEFGDIVILKGGGVVTGAYYLGVGYADDDKTETNVLAVSNPVYIVPANDDSFPREMISGAPNGTQTDKSIQWKLNNVNTEYKYIVPYVVQYSGTVKSVYKLENVSITSSSINVVYSGLEKAAASSIEEAAIDKVRYLTAKSITQLDNKLYAANLTSRPDLGFQRFANNIKVEPIVELVTPFDPRRYDVYTLNEGYSQLVYPDPNLNAAYNVYSSLSGSTFGPMGEITGNIRHTQLQAVDGISEAYVINVIIPIQKNNSAGYRDPNLLFKKKGYRRGEVYSFYISFVLKDGSESYAYHIPGRDKIEEFEDEWTLFESSTGYTLGAKGGNIKTGEIKQYDNLSRVYQYFDTSYMGGVPLYSNMGYWQNLNEFYPNNKNFEIWGVDPSGQSVYISTLANTNVRHHKMPSNHNDRYSHIVRDTYFGDIALDDPMYSNNADGYRIFNDQVRILGIKLKNLKIPKFILKQVQGYKVYYAKRTYGNKTILGQSGAHPATSYLASNIVNKSANATTGPYFNIWALDGHLKYGGLFIGDSLWVENAPFGGPTAYGPDLRNFNAGVNQVTYVGNPVFKFHDFNLLRKRPTLSTLTHIDVQYIVLMESWRGGYKGAIRSKVTGATGADDANLFYRTFRSGIGDDAYAWVHEDLGNMINFNRDAENDLYWDNPGPKILWGNVFIGARYSTPGVFNDYTGQKIDEGVLWYDKTDNNVERYLGDINGIPNIVVNQSALLSNTQTIFMVEPEGSTYVNGLSILKSATANGFKGATYLYNAFGESCITITLASGLPMLGGYKSNDWSYIGLSNLIWGSQIFYKGSGTNTVLTSTFVNLLSGHDINFERGYITDPNNPTQTANDNLTLWYTTENIFIKAISKYHSSLRQPTPLSVATPLGSIWSGTARYGIGWVATGWDLEIISTGSGSTSSIQPGMYISVNYPGNTGPANIFTGPDGPTNTAIIESVGNGAFSWQINYLIQLTADYSVIASTDSTAMWVYIGNVLPGDTIANDIKSRPNTYLINVCSNKTDVFEPFDRQELVWTGYYKSLLDVDATSGVSSDNLNYYYGDSSTPSESGDVFGGDTYICRYSYRTTSNLYGLARFLKGVNKFRVNTYSGGGFYLSPSQLIEAQYVFGDIPINLATGKTPNFGLTNIFGTSSDYNVLFWGGGADNGTTNLVEGAGDEYDGSRRFSITTNENWGTSGYEVFTTIYQYVIESDDNINYRHAGDPEKGVSELNSMYFDKYVAADVLYRSPLGDLTKMDNILYEDHYSALQDIRVPIPFPKESTNTLAFPNRVIRSATQDGNFNDTYRYFLALQYKDFAVNKGPINNIFNLKALLYIHTEKSLFRTKGKQNLELGDATQAYIGSGDLFAQEPDEFIQSTEGYNGLYNKMGSLVTKDGYIFVARKSRKIFLVKDEVVDLTQLGINAWARENIPFALEAYGWDPDYTNTPTDAPTADFGFLVSYDPLFKRTLITKRELVFTDFAEDQFSRGLFFYNRPTAEFKTITGTVIPLEEGVYFKKGGWTISFSNSYSVWASRHSYVPPLYAFNSKYLYSFDYLATGTGSYPVLYEHSDFANPGRFYGTVYNFEIDCIFTAPVNAVYSGFKYTADVFNKSNIKLAAEQQFSPGFTSFYVYNTTQISGEVDLVYLNNIRKTDNTWNVNAFRDLSKIASSSGLAVGQINVQGIPYTSTSAPTSVEPMFSQEGIINLNYIDSNKPWYEQRKFVDKFLGIRLISNNLSRNLINLYTVTAALRVSPR